MYEMDHTSAARRRQDSYSTATVAVRVTSNILYFKSIVLEAKTNHGTTN